MEFNANLTIEEWTGNNDLAISIFNNKYKNGNETFMETIDRISGGNEEIKQLILEKKFLPGGRIMSNRGLYKHGKKVSLSNCYVMPPIQDNLESIFDTAKMLARTFSYGGGCGITVSNLAFRGAKVKNAAESSSGAVSFMDLYSHVTGLIAQNGRRGALMITMRVDHPDIEEFIDIKQDLDKVTKANISIQITDEFMKAVKNDEDFTLKFTREETGETKTKTVRAKELFRKIAQANYDMGEPGMLFWDRITGYNLLSEDEEFKLVGTNPCVTGDTLILTDAGYYPIKMLVGSEVTIWNGYEWSNVIPQVTGLNQPIRRITLSDGSFVDCTDYHKFILNDGSKVEAKDLKEGDALVDFEYPIIPGWIGMDEKIAYTKGFLTGDGCVDERGRKYIYLYEDKKNLYPYLVYEKFYDHTENSNRYTLQVPQDAEWMNDKYWVPNESLDIKTRLNWLAGLIDSDGSLNDEYGAISISSIHKDLLQNVKFMLSTLGIRSKITLMKKGGVKLMPDGKGGKKEYYCQDCYRIMISAYYVGVLMNLGLRTHRVPLISKTVRKGKMKPVCILSNIPMGIADQVFCVNEPKNHSVVFNGVVTGNCGELPLVSGGACLLGAINLSAFVKNPFTSEAEFMINDFIKTVESCIKQLDLILDEGIEGHPLEIQKDAARNWRSIGLGIMGLSDLLIKMGIRYGSDEAIELCDYIGKIMAGTAILTSCQNGDRLGTFPKLKQDKVQESEFFKNNAPIILQKSNHGAVSLRNGQLLTIAPTGSLSNVLGISGGIEPIFANSYTRKTQTLHEEETFYKVYTPIVKEYMEKFGIEDEKDLPNYFVTAPEIPYEERVKMQAAWQRHIDNSISSTVNLPESATVEDIEDLYMKAWENGLKGITVFRDNCKRTGILTTDKKKEENVGVIKEELKDAVTHLKPFDSEVIGVKGVESETIGPARGEVVKVRNENISGLKRKLITGCGSLHCEAFFDKTTGELVETFLSKGSTGGCNNFMVGLSRFISMAARLGASIYDIVDQLQSTGSCPSYAVRRAVHKDTSKGSCCPMAVGNALLDMYEEFNKISKYAEKERDNTITIDKEWLSKLLSTVEVPDEYKTMMPIDVEYQLSSEERKTIVSDFVSHLIDNESKPLPRLMSFKHKENECISVNLNKSPLTSEAVNDIFETVLKQNTEIKYTEEALCPQCGSKLDHEGGCDICRDCGWTRCD